MFDVLVIGFFRYLWARPWRSKLKYYIQNRVILRRLKPRLLVTLESNKYPTVINTELVTLPHGSGPKLAVWDCEAMNSLVIRFA